MSRYTLLLMSNIKKIMKKVLLSFAFLLALTSANAQREPETESTTPEFNKWSIELNGGVNKPSKPFTNGYFTDTPNFYNGDLGVRYMFNNKFGIKADVGYYNLKNSDDSAGFESKYYRTSLQGVLNMGRVLNFENWTNTFGALIHAGPGYAQFKTEGKNFTDRMGTFMIGITGQIKLSNRIVLTGDFTSITNVRQDLSFDGNSLNAEPRGFNGGLFTGTVGLTFYLGKNDVHADWYADANKYKEEIEALEKRVGDLETLHNDADMDGVPDYLDKEPNSTPGVLVDSKGRVIDTNNNGIPDELESYLEKTYGGKTATTNNQLVKDLINGGYVTTYFDFNKSQPTNVSTEGIDFILTYLRSNPETNVAIYGHADEIGKSDYNTKLANSRAEAVKNILVKSNVSPSRLTVVSSGEDNSVDPNSVGARKLVRRVTFKVN
jgi:OOP family OmpA-OmpF porin